MRYGLKLKNILLDEKSDFATWRPIISYRKVFDGLICILRTGCQWKILSKEYCSGSTFQSFKERTRCY